MMAHFEIYEDPAGDWRYRLKAGNGEIVATGEGYDSEQNVRRGIANVITAVLFAVDQPVGLAHAHEAKVLKVPS